MPRRRRKPGRPLARGRRGRMPTGSGRAGRAAGAARRWSEAGGLEALASAHEAVSAHHGNNYLPLLDQHYRSHRSALFTLVNAIELEATSAERSVVDAVEFLRALRGAKAAYVPERVTVERPGADGEPADGDPVDRRGRVRLGDVAEDPAGQGPARDAGAPASGGVRVLLPGCRASAGGHRGGRVGLVRQPARPAHVVGGVPAAGRRRSAPRPVSRPSRPR